MAQRKVRLIGRVGMQCVLPRNERQSKFDILGAV